MWFSQKKNVNQLSMQFEEDICLFTKCGKSDANGQMEIFN